MLSGADYCHFSRGAKSHGTTCKGACGWYCILVDEYSWDKACACRGKAQYRPPGMIVQQRCRPSAVGRLIDMIVYGHHGLSIHDSL